MTKSAMVICASVCALGVLAGCGGSGDTKQAKGGLPPAARPVYASDHAVTGHLVSAHTSGTLLASLGFDPARDGFSFQNYGFIAGTELDQHTLRELFGDSVCAGAPSDSCTLLPAAQQWAEQASDAALIGHCYGFSMTALRFFKHLLDPNQFGGSTPNSLSLTPALQSEIVYAWVTQLFPSVQHAQVLGEPSQIVTDLEQALKNPGGEVYTLAFGNGSTTSPEGHAVTPIGVEDLGNGRFQILIYDNNKPDTTQAVTVDANAQTWSYQTSLNPNDPSTLWSGQGTNNEMDLAPLSASLRREPCPFCGGAGAKGGMDTISLGGNPSAHGHLLITTSSGRRLGFVKGRFVNEIKGARVIRPDASEVWKAHPEPIYQVPAGQRFTVTLDGTGATGNDMASVHVTGPGFGATLTNLRPRAGSRDLLVIAPGASTVSLRTRGDAPGLQPVLQLVRDRANGGNELSATPQKLGSGQQLTVALPPGGNRVSVKSSGAKAAKVQLVLRRINSNGAQHAHTVAATVQPGRAHTFSTASSG